jgi:hypothetical protein
VIGRRTIEQCCLQVAAHRRAVECRLHSRQGLLEHRAAERIELWA